MSVLSRVGLGSPPVSSSSSLESQASSTVPSFLCGPGNRTQVLTRGQHFTTEPAPRPRSLLLAVGAAVSSVLRSADLKLPWEVLPRAECWTCRQDEAQV